MKRDECLNKREEFKIEHVALLGRESNAHR